MDYDSRKGAMICGLNNNVRYKGKVYHIQTEDGGLKNPVISTIVFKEGKVVASKRTSYADILKFERLETVVKELIKEQHIAVFKTLRAKLLQEEEEREDKK